MVFGVFGIVFMIAFFGVAAIIVITVVKGIGTWNRNNNSPRLTVPAVIVSKRTEVSHHRHANAGDISGAHGHHTTASTQYYITFQFDSGDRMEFSVRGSEYGMLAEGDAGSLSFQGTRYLDFERKI